MTKEKLYELDKLAYELTRETSRKTNPSYHPFEQTMLLIIFVRLLKERK